MAAADRTLSAVTILVPDYDPAIDFFCRVLQFTLTEDSAEPGDRRWVTVAPSPTSPHRLLIAKATTPAQIAAIGNQAGGRVFLFLRTDDFDRDHQRMLALGVRFLEEPRSEPYGRVAVFADPFGNKWDLLGPPPDRPVG